MNSIIQILYRTNKTFEYIDNQYEDDLDAKTTLIFIVFGLVVAAESYFKDNLADLGLKWIILIFLFAAGVGLILGKYVFSNLIFWIGKILKGKSKLIDIKAVIAYSLIPRIIELPIILYLGLSGKYGELIGFELYVINGIYIILSILAFKILLQGLVKFNDYGFGKAIINLSPFILIGLTLILIMFLI